MSSSGELAERETKNGKTVFVSNTLRGRTKIVTLELSKTFGRRSKVFTQAKSEESCLFSKHSLAQTSKLKF